MKKHTSLALVCLLVGMLIAMDQLLGRRVLCLTASFAAIWFMIAFVLLSRPPGIPEFVSEKAGGDEQYVVRRDPIPPVPLLERIALSLTIACGSCLLIWLTLGLMGR